MEQERTVKIEQIQKVLGALSRCTLETYLKHWRFAPFVRRIQSNKNRWHYEYVYCKDFFNNFYTYLIMKRKIYEARNLKDTFAQVGIQLEYWRNRMSYYFMGTDEEFKQKHPICNNFMPFADEEGRYNSWLCMKDCRECDLRCTEHHKPHKLNPDIAEFFNATCERYRK